MSALLSPDKQTHLAHVILKCLEGSKQANMKGDSALALREIKRVLGEHMVLEEELDRKDPFPFAILFPPHSRRFRRMECALS